MQTVESLTEQVQVLTKQLDTLLSAVHHLTAQQLQSEKDSNQLAQLSQKLDILIELQREQARQQTRATSQQEHQSDMVNLRLTGIMDMLRPLPHTEPFTGPYNLQPIEGCQRNKDGEVIRYLR